MITIVNINIEAIITFNIKVKPDKKYWIFKNTLSHVVIGRSGSSNENVETLQTKKLKNYNQIMRKYIVVLEVVKKLRHCEQSWHVTTQLGAKLSVGKK